MPSALRFVVLFSLSTLFSLPILVPADPACAAQETGADSGAEAPSPELAQARELLEAQRPAEALPGLDRYLKRRPKSAEALLLRSTAHIMLGELEAGRRDLKRSLDLDPEQREAWLNLGAIAISEQQYDQAQKAFEKAEALSPGAPENDLNLGAVLLLRGKLEPASERFSSYLDSEAGDSSQGYYLVATNYALAGYAALALEHLKRAVELDERARLRARTDANFSELERRPEFRRLMATDAWRPPPGYYVASRTYETPYQGGKGDLLKAVLDTLQIESLPFDPRVEVTSDWALIWGEVRIKVTHGPEDRGKVELSAAPDRFTPAEWRQRVETLFEGILRQLVVRSASAS